MSVLRDAEIILVAYGISARIAKEAVELARARGMKLGLIRPITLWPFPRQAFEALGEGVKGFLCVEMSILGQLAEDVRLACRGPGCGGALGCFRQRTGFRGDCGPCRRDAGPVRGGRRDEFQGTGDH